jgi:hypothetical protein
MLRRSNVLALVRWLSANIREVRGLFGEVRFGEGQAVPPALLRRSASALNERQRRNRIIAWDDRAPKVRPSPRLTSLRGLRPQKNLPAPLFSKGGGGSQGDY